MHMVYNSDSFAVLQLDAAELAHATAGDQAAPDATRGGFEIVDKAARKGIFLDGQLAQGFLQRAQALVKQEADADALEAFVAAYAELAQQPVALH